MAEALQIDQPPVTASLTHDWGFGSGSYQITLHGSGGGFVRGREPQRATEVHQAMFESPLDDIDS